MARENNFLPKRIQPQCLQFYPESMNKFTMVFWPCMLQTYVINTLSTRKILVQMSYPQRPIIRRTEKPRLPWGT